MTDTSQPVAKASYSGEAVPAVGTAAYSEAQRMANPPARVNPDTIGSTPASKGSYTYKAINGLYYDSETGQPSLGSPKELKDVTEATAEKFRQQAQQLTDVINTKYASKISADKDLIASTDARARVLNTRTGVNDSATGDSAVLKVQEKGNKVIAADEASQAAEIAAALGKIDAMQSNEQKANEAQARNDLVTSQNLRLKNKTDAEASLKALATAGVDLSKLKESEPAAYQNLITSTGLSPMELEAFHNTYKTAANQTKWQYKVAGDKVVAYGVNAKGELVTDEQEVPGLSAGNFQIMKGDNGTLYKINKDTNEVTPLVNAAKPPAPVKNTKDTPTSAQKNEQADALNWIARQPGYSEKDKNMFQDDETFRAWAIKQAKDEKAATKKGGRSI